MPAFIGGITVPPVSEEFLKTLRSVFQPYEIVPGFDRDKAMMSAGEQRMIQWIEHHARQGRTITGDPEALKTVTPTGAIVKLGA